MPAYKIDHFGSILDKDEWLAVIERCENNEIEFAMKPTIKAQGTDTESGKFLINDPAGNLLEFKYYRNFKQTVG